MTLLEEIQSKCTPQEIDSGDFHVIDSIVSAGRVKANSTEVGYGTILETVGLTKGNAMIDVITATPDYKYVVPLLEQGRLLIGSALAQAAVQAFVPALLTQGEADSLKNLGLTPDPVGWEACRTAIQGA